MWQWVMFPCRLLQGSQVLHCCLGGMLSSRNFLWFDTLAAAVLESNEARRRKRVHSQLQIKSICWNLQNIWTTPDFVALRFNQWMCLPWSLHIIKFISQKVFNDNRLDFHVVHVKILLKIYAPRGFISPMQSIVRSLPGAQRAWKEWRWKKGYEYWGQCFFLFSPSNMKQDTKKFFNVD